jgi:hypothetical protein
MEKLVLVFGTVAVTIGGIFLFIIFGTLIGGLAGWVVGFVFGDIILNIAGQLGVHGVTMFQLGCFLGFVGGFLKTKVSAEVKQKSS